MLPTRPASLLLQWHLSDVCNLRCTHCYQASYRHEPYGLAEWLRVLDDYLAFLRNPGGTPLWGHIHAIVKGCAQGFGKRSFHRGSCSARLNKNSGLRVFLWAVFRAYVVPAQLDVIFAGLG